MINFIKFIFLIIVRNSFEDPDNLPSRQRENTFDEHTKLKKLENQIDQISSLVFDNLIEDNFLGKLIK